MQTIMEFIAKIFKVLIELKYGLPYKIEIIVCANTKRQTDVKIPKSNIDEKYLLKLFLKFLVPVKPIFDKTG